ncbi:MAG: fibronectin type III domain-containing protein, partial [Kiritimatiellae bacterium]|nr:fibronectin type III domain-containing protein [Kiritimatiellia bacterium]
AGNSPYSAIADATTPADLQPPAAPGNLTATAVSATQIGLTWSDNSSDETLFKIDRRKSGMDTWVRIAEPAANTTVASDSGLDPETKYYYQIKAYNAAGNSPYSAIADATTPAAAQPPAAPSDLAATAGSSTRIDLTWSDNSSDETRFKIDRRQSGTDLWVRIAEPAADSTAHSDAGLAAETKYYYKIKAYNALGNSAYSAVAAATTPAGDDGVKIAKGATWRYRKGTTEASKPLDAWRLAAFDDSAWSASPAPFGYGDGPYGTTLADMRYTYSCVFLRSAFSIQNPASVAELDLWAQFDDAFIMWINGQEVARVNMDGVPGSPVARDALAASNMGPVEWTATLTSSALPALHDGENVLTVQVFNRSLDSSDLTFDAQLSIVNSQLSIDADADQDAMPDAWEAAHLADLADPSDRSASADPDDDGLSNLEEFIAGTDPVSGADCFAVDVALVNGKIVISFTAAAASGAGYEGYRRHYALECQNGTSGGHWEPVAGYADILGQDQTVTYTNAAPGAGACYRARVWLETD